MRLLRREREQFESFVDFWYLSNHVGGLWMKLEPSLSSSSWRVWNELKQERKRMIGKLVFVVFSFSWMELNSSYFLVASLKRGRIHFHAGITCLFCCSSTLQIIDWEKLSGTETTIQLIFVVGN